MVDKPPHGRQAPVWRTPLLVCTSSPRGWSQECVGCSGCWCVHSWPLPTRLASLQTRWRHARKLCISFPPLLQLHIFNPRGTQEGLKLSLPQRVDDVLERRRRRVTSRKGWGESHSKAQADSSKNSQRCLSVWPCPSSVCPLSPMPWNFPKLNLQRGLGPETLRNQTH